MRPILVVWLVCVVGEKLHRAVAQEEAIQKGIALAIAKGKEILDHGVNVESERKNSIDFFGVKFGTSNGVHSGFGDAATEKTVDSFEEDLERKKRAVDVLSFLHSNGLLGNPSSSGTNVNIVKISSVSNVNNFGPLPETTTVAAAARLRKRSALVAYKELDEKVSYVTSDSEMKPDRSFKSRSVGGIHEGHFEKLIMAPHGNEGAEGMPAKISSKKASLIFKKFNEKSTSFESNSESQSNGSVKTHTASLTEDFSKQGIALADNPEEGSRRKRSPQDADMPDASTEQPRRGGGGGKGKRKGPPGEGGPNSSQRGPGKRGGGGGGGRGGGGRGPPPPDDDDDNGGEDIDENTRSKRAIRDYADANRAGNRSGDSSHSSGSESQSDDSGSDSHSDSSSSIQEDLTTELVITAEVVTEAETQQLTRDKRSPCGGRSTVPTTAAARRRKRDTIPEEVKVEQLTRDKRSPCEGRSTVATTAAARRRKRETVPDLTRAKRSPCGRGRSTVATTMAVRRRKRETIPEEQRLPKDGSSIGEEEASEVKSWFSTVVEVIVESARKVAAVTKRVFGRDDQGNAETNGAMTMNPNAETFN